MTKPTLVTGANGHVGNNLCRLLVERGERVRALIRPSADPAPLAGLDVEIVRGDIMNAGDAATAEELEAKLMPWMRAAFIESNPIPAKAALHMMGRIGPRLRLPLVELAPEFHDAVRDALRTAGVVLK